MTNTASPLLGGDFEEVSLKGEFLEGDFLEHFLEGDFLEGDSLDGDFSDFSERKDFFEDDDATFCKVWRHDISLKLDDVEVRRRSSVCTRVGCKGAGISKSSAECGAS